MIDVDVRTPSTPLAREQVVRTLKVGYRGQLAATTGVLYTAPSLTSVPTGTAPCTACIRSIHVCNTDTTARTYTITVVESGGSVADNRAIFKDVAIAAKTTHFYIYAQDAMPLGDGETINGLADSATKVTVRIGVEEMTC